MGHSVPKYSLGRSTTTSTEHRRPIHSTGIQHLTQIPRYEVTLTAQYALSDEGTHLDPLHVH